MQTEQATPDSPDAPERFAGLQYHPTTLAVKHGISRADARKALAAAGASRERADEIALTMTNKRAARRGDEATQGSGNRNADHGVGTGEQKLQHDAKRRPTPEEEGAFRLPQVDERAREIKGP